MKKFFHEHPTVRGFAIIAAVALVIMALNLYVALFSLMILARIAFFLALAFFVFLMWKERREDIATWPRRAYAAFYGGAAVMIVAFGYYVLNGAHGLDAVAFLVVIAVGGLSMWRTWRDQHTYG